MQRVVIGLAAVVALCPVQLRAQNGTQDVTAIRPIPGDIIQNQTTGRTDLGGRDQHLVDTQTAGCVRTRR
jgi:hypothetical protein